MPKQGRNGESLELSSFRLRVSIRHNITKLSEMDSINKTELFEKLVEQEIARRRILKHTKDDTVYTVKSDRNSTIYTPRRKVADVYPLYGLET